MAEQFEVIDQQQTMARQADGLYGDVIRVKYQAKPSGVVGSVDVPLSKYTAENVVAAIMARVNVHDEVADL